MLFTKPYFLTVPFFLLFTSALELKAQSPAIRASGFTQYDSIHIAATNCGVYITSDTSDAWQRISAISDDVLELVVKRDTMFGARTYGPAYYIPLQDPTYSWQHSAYDVLSITPLTAMDSNDSLLFFSSSSFLGFTYGGSNLTGVKIYGEGLPYDSVKGPFTGASYIPTCNIQEILITDSLMYCVAEDTLFRSDFTFTGWTKAESLLDINYLENVDDTLYAAKDTDLYRSVDHGLTWALIHTAPSRIVEIVKFKQRFYLATETAGMFSSADASNWISENSGIPGLKILDIYASEYYLFAGVDSNGIAAFTGSDWVSLNAGIDCSDIGTKELNQHEVELYPNPASSFFTISIPRGERVRVSLFDMTGNKVLTADAHSEETIPVGHLPKGLYMVQLKVGSQTIVRKLILQ